MDDQPELYTFRPQGGDGWRAELARKKAESQRRQLARMIEALAFADACSADVSVRAEALLDAFFAFRHVESGDECHCSCHPRLPDTDLHDYGADCFCRRTAGERRRSWDAWTAENERYWASEEGRAIAVQREAERTAVRAWVASDPAVVVDTFGGLAPEQWEGTVDGHSFYFRERHDPHPTAPRRVHGSRRWPRGRRRTTRLHHGVVSGMRTGPPL